jgi:hypothetical protein
MALIKPKMLPDIPASKITEDASKRFLTVAQLQAVSNMQGGSEQNSVTVGEDEIVGDLTLIAGDNVNLITDTQNKTITVNAITGGGGGSDSIEQITKLGVVGSTETPKVVEITISEPTDFKYRPVEILKFQPGDTSVNTVCDFDNSDASDFQSNDNVEFDGVMKPKVSYSTEMTDDGAVGTGNQFSVAINKSQFKSIDSLEVV